MVIFTMSTDVGFCSSTSSRQVAWLCFAYVFSFAGAMYYAVQQTKLFVRANLQHVPSRWTRGKVSIRTYVIYVCVTDAYIAIAVYSTFYPPTLPSSWGTTSTYYDYMYIFLFKYDAYIPHFRLRTSKRLASLALPEATMASFAAKLEGLPAFPGSEPVEVPWFNRLR